MIRSRFISATGRGLIAALGCFAFVLPAPAADNFTSGELAHGRRLFQSYCVRCHGMFGGGGLGPNLNRPKLRYGADLPALIGVISNGIPNTPMPAGWQFSSNDVRHLAGYVLSLGQVPREIVPGDPARGRALFTGKGECTKCHSVRREGGVQGPDLTDVGLRRGVEFLKQSLLDPGAELPQEMTDDFSVAGYSLYLPVKIVTQGGRELEATRVNEDGFTIQVRDSSNQPFSFRKSELNTLRKEFGKSIMPSYTTTLLPGEIDDLVAYLTTLRGDE